MAMVYNWLVLWFYNCCTNDSFKVSGSLKNSSLSYDKGRLMQVIGLPFKASWYKMQFAPTTKGTEKITTTKYKM